MADACHKLEKDTHGKSHDVNTSLPYISVKFVEPDEKYFEKKNRMKLLVLLTCVNIRIPVHCSPPRSLK